MKEFNHSLTIQAPPAAVLDAFFDADALATWWRVKRSLCVARPLGVYAIGYSIFNRYYSVYAEIV